MMMIFRRLEQIVFFFPYVAYFKRWTPKGLAQCPTTVFEGHLVRISAVSSGIMTRVFSLLLLLFTYLLTYLLKLSLHSVAVVLTLVQTKQIRTNIHKRNNTKTQYKQYKYTY
jgi:hypothetical protein